MKNLFVLALAFGLSMAMMLTFTSCGGNSQNKGENANETDAVEQEKKIYLDTLTLDDNAYTLSFEPTTTEYTVNLPAGRPPIPRVKATAQSGYTVKINQAALPDGQKSGDAVVVVEDGEGAKNTYTIKFVRDRANGFVLQYDDRFEFPKNENKAYTYSSSNAEIVSVDENGLMTAKALSSEPVTITASENGTVAETLVIDRVEKAHINLFFITGQSNGQGCYDSSNYKKDNVPYLIPYEEQLTYVEKIGQKGRVYSFDVHPVSMNTAVSSRAGTMYDMDNFTKQGHQAALGKTFYELSGEKVVFLQSAWSGSPIESWLDPKRHDEAGTYGGNYFYQTTKSGYNKLTKILQKNYEIVYTANFWCQGETAMNAVYNKRLGDYIFSSSNDFNKKDLITDQTYYNYFMMLHEDMKADFGLQYNGIMMVKSKGVTNQTQIVPIVSAHFALCNNNADIHVASRTFIEIATQYSDIASKDKEGYGYMGTDNNHYNQIGYNYLGKECATNAFNAIFGQATNEPEYVEVIAKDGKTRIGEGENVDLKNGSSLRLAALCVPHYVNEKLTWTVNKPEVATVNDFGCITGAGAGVAKITVTSESGKSVSFYVTVS